MGLRRKPRTTARGESPKDGWGREGQVVTIIQTRLVCPLEPRGLPHLPSKTPSHPLQGPPRRSGEGTLVRLPGELTPSSSSVPRARVSGVVPGESGWPVGRSDSGHARIPGAGDPGRGGGKAGGGLQAAPSPVHPPLPGGAKLGHP